MITQFAELWKAISSINGPAFYGYICVTVKIMCQCYIDGLGQERRNTSAFAISMG